MSKKYTGTLTLDWYNKQKSVLVEKSDDRSSSDIPGPKINWVNREQSVFYEIIDDEGRGLEPYWVDRNDIRVKETRPLILKKSYTTELKETKGESKFNVKETSKNSFSQNMLIKGDNLLALRTLLKMFEGKPEGEKIQCVYIDPPFNTESTFENYDDSMEHSLWLTMMKDRLQIIHRLMNDSGTLFLHIDDNELGYITVLCDEIFGRENRAPFITFKQASATGHKAINPGLVSTCNYILTYCKNKTNWKPKKLFTSRDRNPRYNNFVKNKHLDISKWEIITLVEAFGKSKNIEGKNLKKQIPNFEEELDKFVMENAECVIQLAYPDYESVGKETRVFIDKSNKEKGKIFVQRREGFSDIYLINGQRLLFYSERLKMIDGEYVAGEPLTNLWDDILSNNLHNEGGISFPKGKKPEALLKRCIEMTSEEGDVVLDSFLGSGTTIAVAHKMKRKWIGIEVGKHADSHVLPRLCSVLDGSDQTGISKVVKWEGGGSFNYYQLGPSIITSKKNEHDFNWKLGIDFLQESLLSTYDYIMDTSSEVAGLAIFKNKLSKPAIGYQKIGNKTRVAIVSLQEPDDKITSISTEELSSLYETVKSKFAPEYVNIFTNRGVDISYESKPDDLEVIKVPNAIFAELEK